MTVADADFEDWLAALKTVFITGYGYTPENAQAYVYENRREWREYFDDGYTPRTAAAHDLQSAI